MKVLNLTLKKVWFDMIISGEKKEEYREVKPYWISRLWAKGAANFEKFDAIKFTNGYSITSPYFLIECNGIEISTGKTEWGAIKDIEYFVIKLGKIIE